MDSLKTSDDPQKKDELENALQVADAIYDKRAAKIIKLAALAARGHREDVSLADAEAEVYDLVYKVFTHYRDRVYRTNGIRGRCSVKRASAIK